MLKHNCLVLAAGGSKASSKDDGTDALLKQILKPYGQSGGDEVNLESILASATDNESDDHELASPSRVLYFYVTLFNKHVSVLDVMVHCLP